VARGAVACVEPDADAFADAVISALEPDPVRIQGGLATAASTSWARVAALHDDVYDELGKA
jgi:hypothetical protein